MNTVKKWRALTKQEEMQENAYDFVGPVTLVFVVRVNAAAINSSHAESSCLGVFTKIRVCSVGTVTFYAEHTE